MSNLTRMSRYELLRSQLDLDFNTFRPQYQDLNDNILPSRARFTLTDSNRGDRRNHKILDNTAYMAARTLSSGMMAGVTSPARNWKRLTTQDPDKSEFGPVKDWLYTVDSRMSTLFLRSNLYNVLPSLYLDLGVFGTAAILMEEDEFTVSRFYSIPVGTFRIAKDRRGRVNVFIREFRMTVRQIVETFGGVVDGKPDWSNISKQVKNLWDQSNYEAWIDVVHVIEPNLNYDPRRMLISKFKPFVSVYYEKGTSTQSGPGAGYDQNKFLRESGYDFFPVLVPRWMVTGADVYGTDCPGMASIGDVKQLQHGEKRIAQAIDKMVNPAMVGSPGLKTSKASLISGDITYLDNEREFFKPAHEVRIDISHIENKQEQCRYRIKRAFFEDLFLMLASSDRREITAREIEAREEEKLLAVGPVLEQLNQDVLDPLIDNQFYLMNQQGLIPEPPEELQDEDLKVEYISVMQQAQKMIAVGGLDGFSQRSAQIIAINPSSAAKIDFDQIIDEYGEAFGVSPRVVRSDERVEEIRAAEAKQAMAKQQMEVLNQGSQVVKNLAGASTEDPNALTALTQRLTGQTA